MGQYYKPIVLKENWKEEKHPVQASLLSFNFDNGLKLMEHSYIGNNFVQAAMRMIEINDKGNGVPFVWCGDYADPVDTKVYPYVENDDKKTGCDLYNEAYHFIGDGGKTQQYDELLDQVEDANEHEYKYAINHTKKQIVYFPMFKEGMLIINPLPILCSYGNGRGLGDYNDKLINNLLNQGYTKINWKLEYAD